MLAIFEGIEDLLKKMSNFSDCSRALVTLASAVGVIIFFIFAICLAFRLIQLLRLYVFSQFCCKTDFKKKYGKWAVITGSTDGIGQSMAKELARRGMSIIVVARNEERLARTKAMLEQEPNVGEVETVKVDLSDPSMENFDKVRAQIDPDNRDIGLLINNAGSFPDRYARFNRFDMEEIVSIVNLNVLGTLHLTRMIMPGMIERGRGLVMNVSSILGEMPGPYFNVYGATKSFVNAFTRQLQMEYGSHPIDIILLQPGPVSTKQLIATSDRAKPSFFVPSADKFARTSINALSTGIQCYTGAMFHEFMKSQSKILANLGLISPIAKLIVLMNDKRAHLSPVPKRKVMQAVPAPEENVQTVFVGQT
uniref:Hydroxysteroid dehydrogenase-like protein 1 n=1 Tax=Aceria tosichella TaxID=561515 RepID=A0A6G1SPP6_9ACAR